MQFLKILFWCLLAFVAALFTYGNWTYAEIRLWSGLTAEVRLPLLLILTFLVGFLPTQIYHAAVRWRLRQRLGQAEETLATTRALVVAAPRPGTPPLSATAEMPPPRPGELL